MSHLWRTDIHVKVVQYSAYRQYSHYHPWTHLGKIVDCKLELKSRRFFLDPFSSGGEDGAGVRRRWERPDWVWRVPRPHGQEGGILCFVSLCFRSLSMSLSLFFVVCSSCSWPRKVRSFVFSFFVLILCLCSLFLALMPKKVRSCVLSFFDSSSKTKLPLYVCKIKAKVKNTDSKC